LVVQPDPTNLLGDETLGRLLIVGQVISVSLGGVIVQWAQPDIDRVPLTGWSMLLGAVVLHAVSLGSGELPGAETVVPTAVAAVLYLGVFSTAIAFYIYFYIIEVHGAFEVSLVTYLVPVVATLVGVFVLGETISLLTIVGFGLVAVGFVFLKRDALVEVLESGPVAAGP
jgi:drug/metabolite transporter (DMT)-like permease